ncbi:hypothetical protein L6452_39043 [Arctium lappa]|uniref:Uncharacterized protein n=1 Tax=Arctium lappa TaxID=4217 RepID=A0ACB8XRS4_ARCLA|nr:hypothetical protein L6452_39043 [Arctium lappa]
MYLPFLFLLPLIILSYSPHFATSSSPPNVLTQGSSLSVENNKDVLVSPNKLFTAGFHQIGQNAYCFAIWFSEPMSDGNHTLVWMANRDDPVNGKRSKFSLQKTGNLVLTDAGRKFWESETESNSTSQLQLIDSGNLVLNQQSDEQTCLWQSFSFPTDTILPNQPFTKDTFLVSSRSLTNLSSGFYKLYFDNDNVIRLLYNKDEITSVYWPSPWLRPWEAYRSTYNNSRFALLDSKGQFNSTDNLTFFTTDYGMQIYPRRLTLDVDGNIRVYTLNNGSWNVFGKIQSQRMQAGLDEPNCKAIQYTYNERGFFLCYVKTKLFNDYYLGTPYVTYLRLPTSYVSPYHQTVANMSSLELDCPNSTIKLERTYETKHANGAVNFILWFSVILGVIEFICFLFFFCVTQKPSGGTNQTYLAVATGFKRFTYDEIKKSSRKFREEIGRGGGGIVYKGILPDTREVAIKQLNDAGHGEAEFLAEMSIIGKINHRNLIETYGYCAEGNHRILVYEYMRNGSLANNLSANQLDWRKRFDIAIGVAKGLAYLHEECLEWVLHCDVKPHNILLDADYNPKVADFGLSKLFNRGAIENSIFSKIRGTRGYMAPEWVFNLPITSKVDVYSYGMVVLEMITGRSPACDQASDDNQSVDQKRLVSWVREKVHDATGSLIETQIVEILDPSMRDEYDKCQTQILLNMALQCVEEDADARPTMSEVVKMLLHPEMDD